VTARAQRADLLIVGRVATLAGESGWDWQPGLAIGGGRILATGPEAELEVLADARTERWRLGEDQVVLPGITDAHLHLMSLALAETQIDVNGLDHGATLAALAGRHREMLAAGDESGWMLGHGWSAHDLGGWPTADDLEHVAPGRPIALYAHDHHSRWVSHEAMRRARIAAVADPEFVELIRHDDSGQPTGILHEWASTLVDASIDEPTFEQVEQLVATVARRLAGLGLTGCHDPGELNADTEIGRGPVFYRSADGRGRLPLRVHGAVRAHQLERAIELGLRSGDNEGGRFTMGWLKLFADGSLGSRSAALLEPYTDAASNPPTGGPTGMVLMDAAELDDHLRRAASAGISGQVHAIGDGAVRIVLDVFERLGLGRMALMPRIEHAQLVDPQDQPRFGRLGVAASVQPVHLQSDAPQVRAGWGARGEHSFPLRGLLDGGALIPFGTDAPVEPPDPWPGICVAVTRRDPFEADDEPVGAAHAISLERAVRAACLDPARSARASDLGRLTRGARADLIVVPAAGLREPLDAARLASTRPEVTLVDGRVEYRSEGFAPRG
jgi:hypothetical protein